MKHESAALPRKKDWEVGNKLANLMIGKKN